MQSLTTGVDVVDGITASFRLMWLGLRRIAPLLRSLAVVCQSVIVELLPSLVEMKL